MAKCQILLQNGVCDQGDYISKCINALLSLPLIAMCGEGETRTQNRLLVEDNVL